MIAKLIIMFICGAVFSFAIMMMVIIGLYWNDDTTPDETEIEEMYDWYDAEYHGEHEA